jgi:hypothetical protein
VGAVTGDVPHTRPGELCRALLEALESAEGRRRQRKRDTTPDALGLGLKRRLLDSAVKDDPDPDAFEGWLLEFCLKESVAGIGAARAMALELLQEWRLAHTSPAFALWLASGAPSDDRSGQ